MSHSATPPSSTSPKSRKKKITGYTMFCREKYSEHGDNYGIIGPLWSKMSDEEKKIYNEKAQEENIALGFANPPPEKGVKKLDEVFGKMGGKKFDPFAHAPPESVKKSKKKNTESASTSPTSRKRKRKTLENDVVDDDNVGSLNGGAVNASPPAYQTPNAKRSRSDANDAPVVPSPAPVSAFQNRLMQFRAPAALQNVDRDDLKSPSKFQGMRRVTNDGTNGVTHVSTPPRQYCPPQQQMRNSPGANYPPRPALPPQQKIMSSPPFQQYPVQQTQPPPQQDDASSDYDEEVEEVIRQIEEASAAAPRHEGTAVNTTPIRQPFASNGHPPPQLSQVSPQYPRKIPPQRNVLPPQHRQHQQVEQSSPQQQPQSSTTRHNYDPYPFTNAQDEASQEWASSEVANLFAGVARFGNIQDDNMGFPIFERILAAYVFKPSRRAQELHDLFYQLRATLWSFTRSR